MRLTLLALVVIRAALLNSTALAFDEGEPAPPLSIERWLLGEPVHDIGQAGEHIYIVAFWATWAQPSVESLFGLSRLQRDLGDAGVRIIAVSAEPADEVQKFIRTHPKIGTLNIRIATDADGETTIAYLKAAGRGPLPRVFVVNKEGILAWQGHPLEAKPILEKIIAGTYQIRRPGEPTVADAELMAKIEQAESAKNWTSALELIDQLLKEFPGSNEAHNYMGIKFSILYVEQKDYTAAEAWARNVLDNHAEKFFALNNIAWTLMTVGDLENLENRWPDIAHRAARQAYQATQGRSSAIIDTLARSLYLQGYVNDAIAAQQQALAILRSDIDGAPTETSEEALAASKKALREMEAALKYYEDIAQVRNRLRQ